MWNLQPTNCKVSYRLRNFLVSVHGSQSLCGLDQKETADGPMAIMWLTELVMTAPICAVRCVRT